MHAAPPSKSLRPRHGRPGLSRRRSRPQSFRHWPRLRYPAPSVAQQETIPHPQLPARTAARQPQNVQPQIPAIDVASQTTAAAIIHGVELPRRPSVRSSRSRRQSGPCLDRAMSGTGEHFQPADWFHDCSMYGVHSKPNRQNQTADSQIRTSSGRWAQNIDYGTLRVHGDCESKGRLAMSWRQAFGIGICVCLFGSGVWANVSGGSLSQNTGSWVSHSR